MKAKTCVLFVIFITSAIIIGCQTQPHNPGHVLSGLWYLASLPDPPMEDWSEKEFGWGKIRYFPGWTLVIDSIPPGPPPQITLPNILGGVFRIKEISSVERNLYRLIFYFRRGDFDVEFLVHYDPAKDTIWFSDQRFLLHSGSDKPGGGDFTEIGLENAFRKIGGPSR